MRHVAPAFSLAAAALIASGCSDGDVCLTSVDTACAPLYAPTFDQLFTRTLQPTCAQAGGSCHASAGAMGGLVFEDADASYALLLGRTDGRARVVPGDPACSVLIERLESTDPDRIMPRGSALPDGERCAFVQWVHNGAKR
jgi:hypothetical protein